MDGSDRLVFTNFAILVSVKSEKINLADPC
jgi:hypothetical protein